MAFVAALELHPFPLRAPACLVVARLSRKRSHVVKFPKTSVAVKLRAQVAKPVPRQRTAMAPSVRATRTILMGPSSMEASWKVAWLTAVS